MGFVLTEGPSPYAVPMLPTRLRSLLALAASVALLAPAFLAYAGFWTLTLLFKIAFDYFMIIKPLVEHMAANFDSFDSFLNLNRCGEHLSNTSEIPPTRADRDRRLFAPPTGCGAGSTGWRATFSMSTTRPASTPASPIRTVAP